MAKSSSDNPNGASAEIRPIATVDAVVMVLTEDGLKLAVQRRPKAPFEGKMALPGGYIHVDDDEDAEAAVRRVLLDKCGMGGFHLEQLQTFSGMARDPRGWSISICYLALLPAEAFQPEDATVELVDVDTPLDLAFDHGVIVAAALARVRGKGAYSTLPAAFLGETFTFPELIRAYEQVLGTKIDQSSFRRKVRDIGLIEETGEVKPMPFGRPSTLYRLAGNTTRTFDRSLG